MLSIDWKERLKKDTLDFYKNKLLNNDFDIDIIYNGYPVRIDGNVPNEVIRFVGKNIASKIAKKSMEFIEFYDYIWKNKGTEGKLIFSVIMSKTIKKEPDFFLNYIKEKLENEHDNHIINQLLNKSVYQYLKKNENKVDILLKWLGINNKVLNKELEKLIKKLMKFDSELISVFFKKLEKNWLNASEREININISFLKDLAKVDKEFYTNIYLKYKNTRNPVYIDILAHSMKIYHPEFETMVENWCLSGNVRVKKAGSFAKKVLKRLKKGN
ncbi:MAG: hypothetical protein U9N34_04205 [Candidatus Cloacimonadota bacterium]|nr:hypothetical protein [Candidatus Cloacimonadota bacterium]